MAENVKNEVTQRSPKMNIKFNIWVFLKKGKVDHNGLCPIYMRIKLNGECIEKATKLFSNPN